MSRPRHYFAYGSNMCPRQMRLRCPAARPIGPAVLFDFVFLINERGVATIRPLEHGRVHGVLWGIRLQCEQALDFYEGVSEARYGKDRVRLQRWDGRSTSALTYIDERINPGPPRPGYLARVLRGGASFQLPLNYLRELQSWKKGMRHAAA